VVNAGPLWCSMNDHEKRKRKWDIHKPSERKKKTTGDAAANEIIKGKGLEGFCVVRGHGSWGAQSRSTEGKRE